MGYPKIVLLTISQSNCVCPKHCHIIYHAYFVKLLGLITF